MIIVNSILTREGIVLARAWTWLLAQVLRGREGIGIVLASRLAGGVGCSHHHHHRRPLCLPYSIFSLPHPSLFLLLPLAYFSIFPVSTLFAFVCIFDLQTLYRFENLLRQRRSLSPPPFFNLLTAPPLLRTSINTWASLLFFNNFFSPPHYQPPCVSQ